MPESLTLGLALGGYGVALAATWRRLERVTGFALLAALALHTLALAQRWSALGHGPFTTLHEILSSNLWSLALVVAVAWVLLREVRSALPAAWPVLVLLAVWLVASDRRPATCRRPTRRRCCTCTRWWASSTSGCCSSRWRWPGVRAASRRWTNSRTASPPSRSCSTR